MALIELATAEQLPSKATLTLRVTRGFLDATQDLTLDLDFYWGIGDFVRQETAVGVPEDGDHSSYAFAPGAEELFTSLTIEVPQRRTISGHAETLKEVIFSAEITHVKFCHECIAFRCKSFATSFTAAALWWGPM